MTLSGSAILNPNEIAFDASGNLWVSNSADDNGNLWYADDYTEAIGEYTAAQLTSAGGNLTPTISLVSPTGISGVGIAFYPSLLSPASVLTTPVP